MIYLTSDQHFWHSNIILYERRPFADVIEMNKEIITRWNKTVKSTDDIIFVLGDFALANKEDTKWIMDLLRGRKRLVMGNHDRQHSIKWWYDVGFERVYEFPIIYKKFLVLSHEPVYLNESMPYANIHGHTHSKSMNYKGFINVSVECTDYAPVSLDDIKAALNIQEENQTESE